MSITTQIERINTAKAEIKEVVNQDFEKIQDETLTYYPEKIAEVIEEYKKYIPEKKVSGTEIKKRGLKRILIYLSKRSSHI